MAQHRRTQRTPRRRRKAHAQGRELRFWGAPDRLEAWCAFCELGVDRIGTDRPRQAVAALRELSMAR